MDRRRFLQQTGGALGAAPFFFPASAKGANERLVYGVIGAGSRGRRVNSHFQKLGAQCAALCDVYRPHLDEAARESPRGAKRYVDYEDLLARDDLDFVVIATPDHQHRPGLLAALDAGKDVYLEKPLSMSLDESRQMIEAVRKTDRIVQIGMQRRSMPFVMRAKRLIDEGATGKISMVQTKWNWHFRLPLDNEPLDGKLDWKRFLGPAPYRKLEPMRFRWWRAFWDYSGGNMTDQGTHLLDVVQWLTGSGPPLSAVCQGRLVNATGAEAPNVFSAIFEYPEFLATWTLDYRTAYQNDWSITFIGEEATLVLDERGIRIFDDPGASPKPWEMSHGAELSRM
ncbi:MAG: Gfo/Idh/MocA family oxidoreductase, partial [bacterium]|nr:Gfo/Idh/MocA family oxidoreductase [bacterium]